MNERDIFHAAIALTDPAERAAYVERACAGNASLKRHVLDMLEVYPVLGTFLESPAVLWDRESRPPTHAGRFQLGPELARGGMGVVYSARDESLGRDVAVKVLHERYRLVPLVSQRFVEEARITAQLQHPAIPPVFEVGRLDDERPYLAMKLIHGRTLEDLLNERPNPASNRGSFLAAFQQVCQAVGYAHSRHILHRDLKPANVMVGAFGEVQVMDWGLAKMLPCGGAAAAASADTQAATGTVIHAAHEHDSGTLAGSMLGTPAFAAPEQAGGELHRIDERTDVFGLGAILCVILTGAPPYAGSIAEEVRVMAIRGTLGDARARLDRCGADARLVALCCQCLSPEREDRPRDAGAVAATMAGYLAAVEERARQAQLEHAAADARAAEQRKRLPIQLALGAAIALVLVGGIVATTWQALRATQAETVSLAEADHYRRLLYSADVHLAAQAWQSDEGTVSQCQELLLGHVPGPGQLDLREFSWRYQWRLLHPEQSRPGAVVRLPVVPRAAGITGDDRAVTLDETGKVNTWPIGNPAQRQEFTLAGGVLGVTLSHNGEMAAVIDPDGSAKVFDVRARVQKVQIHAPSPLVNLKLSADGRFLAGVGRDKRARVWDSASGKQLYEHLLVDSTVKQIDLSLDGKQLLASVGDNAALVVIYRAGEAKPVLHDECGFNRLHAAFSPDGKRAAVARFGNGVDWYDMTTGQQLRVLDEQGEMVPLFLPSRSPPVRIAFSPDGHQLAVGARTGLITLWRLPPTEARGAKPGAAAGAPVAEGAPRATLRVPRTLKGHQAAIEALAFSADGRRLISIGHDNTVRCWDVADQDEARGLQRDHEVNALSYSPDGRYLVEASMHGNPGGIFVHDLTSTDPPRALSTRGSRQVVFAPDGRTIAGGPDHCVTLWDAQTRQCLGTLTEPKLADRIADAKYHAMIQDMGAEIGALAFSPDSRWLAVGIGGPHTYAVDPPQQVMVFDVAQRREHRTFATPTQVNAVAFSADGKLLAAAGHNGTIWMWDTASWTEVGRWQGPANTGYGAIVFLPRSRLGTAGPPGDRPGELLATGSRSGRIDLWDVNTQALVHQMHGHIGLISVMVVSPDGRTLASASCDGSVKLWDGGTGRELRTLCRQKEWMYALAFSPDGNTLASGGLDPVLQLWEASAEGAVAADLAKLPVAGRR